MTLTLTNPTETKMDRLQIEITGNLPDDGKFAILAVAEERAKELAAELSDEHKLDLSVSVRAVRPGKKGPAAVREGVRAAIVGLGGTLTGPEVARVERDAAE